MEVNNNCRGQVEVWKINELSKRTARRIARIHQSFELMKTKWNFLAAVRKDLCGEKKNLFKSNLEGGLIKLWACCSKGELGKFN